MTSEPSRPCGLFVGLNTVDVIHLVDRLPGPNEKIVANATELAAGGPATNAAVTFAALGGRSILVSRLASDASANLAIGDLQAYGVELYAAPSPAQSTTVASIAITASTGDRAVISATDQGRSAELEESLLADDLFTQYAPDVLLMDSYEADMSIPLAADAQRLGLPVVLDSGSRKQQTAQLLQHVSAAIVSERFSDSSPAVCVQELLDEGVPFAAVTAGERPISWGIEVDGSRGSIDVPVVPAVDTLGAGDFFHGAFAFWIARVGLVPKTFVTGLRFASEVAAVSVQHFGTRTWLAELQNLTFEA